MAGIKSSDDRFSSAQRGVTEARGIVESQKALIEKLRANGSDTEDAERTLNVLVQTLTALEGHLRSLYKSIQ